MGVIIYYIKRTVVEWASCTLGQKWRMFLWVLWSLRRGQHWKRKYGGGIYLCHVWTHYNMELICLCLPCIHLLYSPYTVLNSKLNHASHLCIKNIIEEKTVQRLVSSFFNTLPIIALSRLCQADFSDNFNQIISCSLFNRHLLWLDSGFGLGHRARG